MRTQSVDFDMLLDVEFLREPMPGTIVAIECLIEDAPWVHTCDIPRRIDSHTFGYGIVWKYTPTIDEFSRLIYALDRDCTGLACIFAFYYTKDPSAPASMGMITSGIADTGHLSRLHQFYWCLHNLERTIRLHGLSGARQINDELIRLEDTGQIPEHGHYTCLISQNGAARTANDPDEL